MRWRETPLVLRIYSPTRFRASRVFPSNLQWRSLRRVLPMADGVW